MSQTKVLLNIFGDLPDSLMVYFEKAQVEVKDRSQLSVDEALDFILVSSVEEAMEVSSQFRCMENDIRIICLGKKENVKNFLLANGRLFLNSDILNTEMGEYLLNKFFNQNYNIHLDETFASSFEQVKKFNVINHLNIGQSVDKIATEAFEKGFNIVALRGLIDHIVFYFTYLKQAGHAAVPFEFEYGFNEKQFVLNAYASVDDFSAEFMMDSFGQVNSKDPLNFLLGIVAQSCDFLDITYIEEPGKVVLTSFFGRDEAARIEGLSFNNILTTSQILAQVEKKLAHFEPLEDYEVEVAQKQNALFDQGLPGSFFDPPAPPPADSILSQQVHKTQEAVEFVQDNFAQSFPGMDMSAMTPQKFDQMLQSFPDQDFVQHMTDADKEHLLEKIKHNQFMENYAQEQEQVKKQLEADPNFQNNMQESLAKEMADRVADQVDAAALNQILSGESPAQGEGFNMALDPSAFKMPTFTADNDPFASGATKPFMDPATAAKNLAEQAIEHFDTPAQAQAFALNQIAKAKDKFADEESAEVFAKELTTQMSEKIADPKQQQVFEDAVKNQLNIDNLVPSMASSTPFFDGDDPFATPKGVALDPKEAAQKMAMEAAKHFDDPDQAVAFAMNMAAQAQNNFPSADLAQDFAQAMAQEFQAQTNMSPAEQEQFQQKIENFATGNAAAGALPQMPGLPSFNADDPFATAPGEFADPTEVAKKVAEMAKEKFEDPLQAQAFAMNMAFQAQGKFPDPEDFAAALTGEFQDSFDNQEQVDEFNQTVTSLAAGIGDNLPDTAGDPFGSSFVATEQAARTIPGLMPDEDGDQVVGGGNAQEDPSVISIGGADAGEENATKVKGGKDAADKFSQRIKGTSDDKKGEFVARFGNSFEENAEKGKFNVRSGKAKDRKKDMNLFVKATIDNDASLSELDDTIKAFIHREAPSRLNAGLEKFAFDNGVDIASMTDEMLAEFRQKELPNIMSDLLDDEQSIDSFTNELANVGSKKPLKVLGVDDSNFQVKLKERLELKLNGLDGVSEENGHLVVSSEFADDAQVQSLIRDTMQETLQENFQMNQINLDNLSEHEHQIAQDLNLGLDIQPDMAMNVLEQSQAAVQMQQQQMVQEQFVQQQQQNGAMQVQNLQEGQPTAPQTAGQQQNGAMQVQSLADGTTPNQSSDQAAQPTGNAQQTPSQNQAQPQTPADQSNQAAKPDRKTEAMLMRKVQAAENEKKLLEKKVKAMEVQLQAAESTNEKLKQVKAESEVTTEEASVALEKENKGKKEKEGPSNDQPVMSQEEKSKLMNDIKNGRELNPEEVERLNKALESEQRVREMAKNAQIEIKKLQMETDKREQVFQTELKKAEKALKAKETVLEKAKDSMKNVVEKKERELDHYKNQVNELNQKLANDKSTQLKTELKALKQEAETANRMSEVYKNKLESMAKSLNEQKKEDNSALVAEENRNLKRLKTQLENKLNTDTKMLRSLEERYNKTKQGELEAKNQLAQYKGNLKKAEGQVKLLQSQTEKLQKMVAKGGGGASQGAMGSGVGDSKEVQLVKAQNLKLQEKIKQMNQKLEQAAKSGLEMQKKADSVALQKANKDLEASQKEIDLVKEQNAKLQATIEKLNKKYQDVEVKQVDEEKVAEVEAQKEAKADKAAEKEVHVLKVQNEQLQAKLKAAVDKLKKAEQAAASEEPSKKEQRLEQSVKKMNQELTKAQNERDEIKKKAMTMKTKFTGLENENAKLKKENEKLKQAAAAAVKKAKKAA